MKITTFLYSLIFLCAGFCCRGDDDDQGEYYSLEIPELISIRNESPTYSQGDTLWIRTEIPVNLSTEGGEVIDLTQLSGNSDRAYVYLSLFWENGFENPTPVTLSQSEVVPKEGEVDVHYGINATAFIDGTSFRNEFGIILKEEGSFFVGSGSGTSDMPVLIYVDTKNGSTIHINTTFTNAGSDPNNYSFTVE